MPTFYKLALTSGLPFENNVWLKQYKIFNGIFISNLPDGRRVSRKIFDKPISKYHFLDMKHIRYQQHLVFAKKITKYSVSYCLWIKEQSQLFSTKPGEVLMFSKNCCKFGDFPQNLFSAKTCACRFNREKPVAGKVY